MLINSSPVIYIFGPIDSCPLPGDISTDWDERLISSIVSGLNEGKYPATVFNPKRAFSTVYPGQEVVTVNEFVVDTASVLAGLWIPESVGVNREIERAVLRGIPVMAVRCFITCASPYYWDRRVRGFSDMALLADAVIDYIHKIHNM